MRAGFGAGVASQGAECSARPETARPGSGAQHQPSRAAPQPPLQHGAIRECDMHTCNWEGVRETLKVCPKLRRHVSRPGGV